MLVRPPGFAPCSACHLRSFAPMARARAGIPFGSRSLPQAFHVKCLCASGEAVGMPFADKLAAARPSAVVSRPAGSAGRGRVGRKMAPMTKSAARLGVGGGRRFSPPAIMLVGEAARRAGAALRLSWESIRAHGSLALASSGPSPASPGSAPPRPRPPPRSRASIPAGPPARAIFGDFAVRLWDNGM